MRAMAREYGGNMTGTAIVISLAMPTTMMPYILGLIAIICGVIFMIHGANWQDKREKKSMAIIKHLGIGSV